MRPVDGGAKADERADAGVQVTTDETDTGTRVDTVGSLRRTPSAARTIAPIPLVVGLAVLMPMMTLLVTSPASLADQAFVRVAGTLHLIATGVAACWAALRPSRGPRLALLVVSLIGLGIGIVNAAFPLSGADDWRVRLVHLVFFALWPLVALLGSYRCAPRHWSPLRTLAAAVSGAFAFFSMSLLVNAVAVAAIDASDVLDPAWWTTTAVCAVALIVLTLAGTTRCDKVGK